MRIAQIAPLAESVPPLRYGGTERVVAWLGDALVEEGCEVVLFACAGSRTRAELSPCAPGPLREAGVRDHTGWLLSMLEDVRARAGEFDVLHFHVDLLHLPLFGELRERVLTTFHGRLDLPDLHPLYVHHRDLAFVSISDAQRRPLPQLNWVATVPHGLPPDQIAPSPTDAGYLAFLGRISPEKRVDRAIEIAVRCSLPLRIAAKIDPVDRAYYEREIAMLLRHPSVEFVGEIGDAEKPKFLAGARALLFPIEWPEPFGLAMIEAMAAGTPVIAWARGSAPEIVENGVTGFVVDSIDAAVAAVNALDGLDRTGVRRRFEQRFTAGRMARDYLKVYQSLGRRRLRLAAAV